MERKRYGKETLDSKKCFYLGSIRNILSEKAKMVIFSYITKIAQLMTIFLQLNRKLKIFYLKCTKTMIQTFQQYAKERNISTQAISQMKKLIILELPMFIEHEGQKIEVGKRKVVKT